MIGKKNMLSSLSHWVVTAVTEWLLHDFEENEAAARPLGACNCYVTMALVSLMGDKRTFLTTEQWGYVTTVWILIP